jgi:Uncharacterised nucleotidyltransferase
MTSAYLKSSVMLHSSIEEQLLLCCARTHVDKAITYHIQSLIQQKINWPELIEMASCHHVIPLLCRNLQQIDGYSLPIDIRHQLRELNHSNAAFAMSLTSKMLQLLAEFAAVNIPVIPYKGAVLAAAIYGDMCLRQFHDIDLLVAPQDITKSGALLATQGYELDKIDRQYQWEQHFICLDTGVNIDLHQGLAHPFYPFRLSFEHCMQHRQSVELLNNEVQSFNIADLLLVLSVQIAKDAYGQTCILAKVCDIAELVNRYPDMDWNLVIDRANAIGCQRLLLIGLLSAHKLLGTALPASICKLIQDDWVVGQYGKLLTNTFFHPQNAGTLFLFYKMLILIEYPLSAPHNIQLLRGVLTYPYTKLSNFMSKIKPKSNDLLVAAPLPSLAASEVPESKNKSTTPQSRR